MSKMSNIDYTIKEILEWFKDNFIYIWLVIVIIIFAILIHGQENIDINKALDKENRINNIETRLQEQMNYIHKLEADVDNLYRVVE